jgi:transcriptional regulator with XRE-family HTH domain
MDMEPKQLVDALTERGWTQKQIEERTGIPQPTVSKIARGDVNDVMSRSYRALLTVYQEVLAAEAKALRKQLKAPAIPLQPTQHI